MSQGTASSNLALSANLFLIMISIDQEKFSKILKLSDAKPRLKKELRFVAGADKWADREMFAAADKTGRNGVLLLQPYEKLYAVQYELSPRIVDSLTGRDRAVICDFCRTWQKGSNAASISFTNPVSKNSVTFLCCGDLACSQHVRTETNASRISRTQLKEDLTNEDRVERLKNRLREKIEQLGIAPTEI